MCVNATAFDLPDIVAFSREVRWYGESLRMQCPSPCLVVQHRTGRDWNRHIAASPGANISHSKMMTTISSFATLGLACVLLAPETTTSGGNLPCPRIHHANGTSATLRFFGELYVAASAAVFAYNKHSTSHCLVRRLATNPALKLVSL